MRLAVLTNLLSPYRSSLYGKLAHLVGEATVFLSGAEGNRRWDVPDQDGLSVKSTRGVVFRRKRRRLGRTDFDVSYTHIPVGTIGDLIRFAPDAVLSQEMGARTLFAWIYCTVSRTPLVVHWGGTVHTERGVSWLKRLIRRFFFAKVTRSWVSYGDTSTEYLLSLGIARDRIFEAINSVDNEFFEKRVPASLSLSPEPVVLYVGQFIPRKGLAELLRAAACVQRSGHEFTLLLVGEGPQKAELHDMVTALDLKNVVFHTFVQQDQLPGLYRSASVFVLPTLEDVWGLVVNEALLSGIPVLCSKYAGCARHLVPESWQIDPLDIDRSFAPMLEMAIDKGIHGREDFMPPSEIGGSREAAAAIAAAIECAGGKL